MKTVQEAFDWPTQEEDSCCIVATHRANERFCRQTSASERHRTQDSKKYIAGDDDLPEIFWRENENLQHLGSRETCPVESQHIGSMAQTKTDSAGHRRENQEQNDLALDGRRHRASPEDKGNAGALVSSARSMAEEE